MYCITYVYNVYYSFTHIVVHFLEGLRMAKKQVPLRFEEEELERIKHYANTHCKGNLSLAVRQLCTKALEPATAQTAIEMRVEEMIERGIERMVKVNSKGTKASLASLAILSSYMPALGDGLRAVGEILIADEDSEANEQDQEKLDTALYTICNKENISQNLLFKWGWETGGKLQAQHGTPSLLEATRKDSF